MSHHGDNAHESKLHCVWRIAQKLFSRYMLERERELLHGRMVRVCDLAQMCLPLLNYNLKLCVTHLFPHDLILRIAAQVDNVCPSKALLRVGSRGYCVHYTTNTVVQNIVMHDEVAMAGLVHAVKRIYVVQCTRMGHTPAAKNERSPEEAHSRKIWMFTKNKCQTYSLCPTTHAV